MKTTFSKRYAIAKYRVGSSFIDYIEGEYNTLNDAKRDLLGIYNRINDECIGNENSKNYYHHAKTISQAMKRISDDCHNAVMSYEEDFGYPINRKWHKVTYDCKVYKIITNLY